jgi:uncharacterized protein (DUF2236 family)
MAAIQPARGKDAGLFGPGSMAWEVHTHPCMLIGGLRSLIVQALNPLAMAGVAQHSNYKEDPWGRLVSTTDYVMTTTYGDTESAERMIARVKGIHNRVRGVDDVTGLPYSANDPELLLWVHCAQTDSFLAAYRAYGPRVSIGDADRYVGEMVQIAELFGVPSADIPRTKAELDAYMESQEIVASSYAKEAMKFILFPPVPWPGGQLPKVPGSRLLLIPGRAGYSVYALATVAITPARIRRAYGLPWIPLTPVLKASVFAMTRTMRRVAPPPPTVQRALARRREFEGAA